MLSLRDLYRISAQLCLIKGSDSNVFGGLSIIFTGNFAQLPPPVKALPLYGDIRNRSSSSYIDQQTCIGKALWHQFTVVVILTENMRQRGLTEGDVSLRMALKNMRYKFCSSEDKQYLNTRKIEHFPDILSTLCENGTSIITALNSQRDEINEKGSKKFASITSQQLSPFRSLDTWSSTNSPSGSDGNHEHYTGDIHKKKLQELLWSLPPASCKNFTGTLKICKNLPVLIKYNQSTECCITNGAEAKVIDWTIRTHPNNESRLVY